ncbi:inhibitor of growth protein 4-like isoform x3 [Phaffia rhodozyma]|uniref:Chromatin modification-related protein n=1 Tax=Phaffia rhodozyma TaxID=264483 RepID=A0A0F7SL37_PHARH|nr:inhibitor of growth protein 4-like isoform x3 [Phaffia rhodozyma]
MPKRAKKRGRPRVRPVTPPIEQIPRKYAEDDDLSAWFDNNDGLKSDEEWIEDEVPVEDLNPTWAEFRMTFAEIVDQLPIELQRTYTVLRDLDLQAEQHKTEQERLFREYVSARVRIHHQTSTMKSEVPVNRPPEPIPPNELLDRPSLRLEDASDTGEKERLFTTEENRGTGLKDEVDAKTIFRTNGSCSNQSPSVLPSTSSTRTVTNFSLTEHPHPPIIADPPLIETSPNEILALITQHCQLGIKCAEEKFAMASGAYQRVDRHIRRLDVELEAHKLSIQAQMEAALRKDKRKLGVDENSDLDGEGEEVDVDDLDGAEELRAEDRNGEIDEDALQTTNPRRASRGKAYSYSKTTSTPKTKSIATTATTPSSANKSHKRKIKGSIEPTVQVDIESEQVKAVGLESELGMVNGKKEIVRGKLEGMKVTDHEPRYCYCNDVSYGEMVACDNDDCAIEWFHISCCGMTKVPTGKWYCKNCEILRKSKKKKKI